MSQCAELCSKIATKKSGNFVGENDIPKRWSRSESTSPISPTLQSNPSERSAQNEGNGYSGCSPYTCSGGDTSFHHRDRERAQRRTDASQRNKELTTIETVSIPPLLSAIPLDAGTHIRPHIGPLSHSICDPFAVHSSSSSSSSSYK